MPSKLREEIYELHAKLCSALSDPNRILLIYSLYSSPSNVTHLAQELELAQPTVSRHLRILNENGLVSRERQGHSMIYCLPDERVVEALDLLRNILTASLKQQGALAISAINIPKN